MIESPFSIRLTLRHYVSCLGALGILSISALLMHAPALLNIGCCRNRWPMDFFVHYRWAVQFSEGLRAGDPYPHWMWRGNYGLGEPALLFYSPLFYYICGMIRLLMTNMWDSMRIVFVLSTILTGFFARGLFRLFLEDGYSLIGAVLLQWVPMIFMLFYFRNWMPWAVAFPALVALMYCVLRPGALERWVDPLVSVAVAALVLTHILSALMALICFSAMYLCFVGRRHNGSHRAIAWLLSAGFGLALSAFFLVPACASLRLITPDYITTTFPPWSNFAFPTITTLAYGMEWYTFQWPVPVLALCGVVGATWHAYRRRDLTDRTGRALQIVLVISWVSLFMASELSYPLWLIDTPLLMIQFPFRFIYVTSATGLIANLLALRDTRHESKTWLLRLVLALPLASVLPATGLLSAKLMLFDAEQRHLPADGTALYRGLGEYRLTSQGEHWEDYYRAGGLAAECVERRLACRADETNSRLQTWTITSVQPTHLRLPLLAFPAWALTLDGAAVDYTVDTATGLISIDVPAGTHRVVAFWKRLDVELIGLGITGLALLVLMIDAIRRCLLFQLASRPPDPY